MLKQSRNDMQRATDLGLGPAVTEQNHPQRHRPTKTVVELANIAGVEPTTVRKLAAELLDMLVKDMEREFATVNDEHS